MIRNSFVVAISMFFAPMLACSQGGGGDGTYVPPYNPGTGGTQTPLGGSGGTSTENTDDYRRSDAYISEQIAMTVNMVISFLWNRDIHPLGKTSFAVSDICLLTGDYTSTGTRQFLESDCTGTGTTDINFDMQRCEHQLPGTQESVIVTGNLLAQWSQTHVGDCSKAVSVSKTITATDLVVTYKWGYTDFERVFSSCDIALNYTEESAHTTSSLSGRVCDIPVVVTFAQ